MIIILNWHSEIKFSRLLRYCIRRINFFLFSSVCVYGGSDRRAQIDTVKSGVQIVIGRYIQSKKLL